MNIRTFAILAILFLIAVPCLLKARNRPAPAVCAAGGVCHGDRLRPMRPGAGPGHRGSGRGHGAQSGRGRRDPHPAAARPRVHRVAGAVHLPQGVPAQSLQASSIPHGPAQAGPLSFESQATFPGNGQRLASGQEAHAGRVRVHRRCPWTRSSRCARCRKPISVAGSSRTSSRTER